MGSKRLTGKQKKILERLEREEEGNYVTSLQLIQHANYRDDKNSPSFLDDIIDLQKRGYVKQSMRSHWEGDSIMTYYKITEPGLNILGRK